MRLESVQQLLSDVVRPRTNRRNPDQGPRRDELTTPGCGHLRQLVEVAFKRLFKYTSSRLFKRQLVASTGYMPADGPRVNPFLSRDLRLGFLTGQHRLSPLAAEIRPD
jgi:hypothetical protein